MKPVIYQVFTRLFGNDCTACVPGGTRQQNGCGHMDDFTPTALEQIRAMGVTHIWYTGIIEHASTTSYACYGITPDHPAVVKGVAGSPYAIRDYYDVDPDLATDVEQRREEFRLLVRRTHDADMKVIVDFVPNHVARHYHSDASPMGTADLGEGDDRTVRFSPNNNFYYIPGETFQPDFELNGYHEYPARATGNDVMHAHPSRNDWYETVKLNYGVDIEGGRATHFSPVPHTWHCMLGILLYWAEQGIDGFRCDMAEMVPVEFWRWVIPCVRQHYPHIIFIAEVYNPALYRSYIHDGHFDYLYDKVGMYDTLRAVMCGWTSARDITYRWQETDDILPHMLYFLENHDEQRLASDFFAGDARKGRPVLLVAALLHRGPFMYYAGQEFGERGMDSEGFSGCDGRTTIFDYWCLDVLRRWRNGGSYDRGLLSAEERDLQDYYRRVLNLCQVNSSLSGGGFYDLMYVNPHLQRQYAFVRHSGDELVLVVANFSDEAHTEWISLPEHLFQCMGQRVDAFRPHCVDLLTGAEYPLALTSDVPVPVSLPAQGGVVLCWKTV